MTSPKYAISNSDNLQPIKELCACTMGEVSVEIKGVAEREDLKRWEDHMFEKAKCWNQYCDGLYSENEVRAVHVVKEDKPDFTYLTTLCEDCIKYTRSYGILVKEKYLMVETKKEGQPSVIE